jgi:hypothetical protein
MAVLGWIFRKTQISGSFVLFDNAAKPTWLIIKTLDELEEIAGQIEPHISEKVINSIAKGEVVPYFGDSEYECFSNEKKLRKCLHPARQLKGNKTYCYAILDALPEFPLERDKILSFDKYMENI